MFLARFKHDRDPADLATARRLLRWVNDQALADDVGRAVLADQPRQRGDARRVRARRGRHRVGQPAGLARDRRPLLPRRRPPGGRLVAVGGDRGPAWAELPGDPTVPVHVGLDSGAAGIGWVLDDLARAGIEPAANRAAARAALAGLRGEPFATASGRSGTRTAWPSRRLGAEPSWHWGAAGIAAFAARLSGWSGTGPAARASSLRLPDPARKCAGRPADRSRLGQRARPHRCASSRFALPRAAA